MRNFTCFLTEAKVTHMGKVASVDSINPQLGNQIQSEIKVDKGRTKWRRGAGATITLGDTVETDKGTWIVFDYNPYTFVISAINKAGNKAAEIDFKAEELGESHSPQGFDTANGADWFLVDENGETPFWTKEGGKRIVIGFKEKDARAEAKIYKRFHGITVTPTQTKPTGLTESVGYLVEAKVKTKADYETQFKEAKDALKEVEEELTDIMKYLNSSKFSSGDLANYVNRNDILPRLNKLRMAVGDVLGEETQLSEAFERSEHNQKLTDWLTKNGIKAKVKYLPTGSLKGSWTVSDPKQKWTKELMAKFTGLGFTDHRGKPLTEFSGNGGVLSIQVRPPQSLIDELGLPSKVQEETLQEMDVKQALDALYTAKDHLAAVEWETKDKLASYLKTQALGVESKQQALKLIDKWVKEDKLFADTETDKGTTYIGLEPPEPVHSPKFIRRMVQ